MSIVKDVTRLNKAGKWCLQHHIPIISKVIEVVKRLLFPACDIPMTVELGEGVEFPHRAIGVIVHAKAKIGAETKIEANVVIGGRNDDKIPQIGRNCFIGAGVTILGGVTIGDNCRIGAGAVVLNDIPDGCVAVGVPARIIKTGLTDGRPGRKR